MRSSEERMLRRISKKRLTFYALACIFVWLDMLKLEAKVGILREGEEISSSGLGDKRSTSFIHYFKG